MMICYTRHAIIQPQIYQRSQLESYPRRFLSTREYFRRITKRERGGKRILWSWFVFYQREARETHGEIKTQEY
jgi:hypothetical protein